MTLPIALILLDKRCVVVGSGEEAQRRVAQFQAEGARVRWVTRGAGTECPDVELEQREFEISDLEDAWVVILADQDAPLAAKIGSLCSERRIFFCAIDQPKHNSFSHMARINAAPVTLAISTAGRVPGLAGRLGQLLGQLSSCGHRVFRATCSATRRGERPHGAKATGEGRGRCYPAHR
jgi:siroheme synthase-like protein